MNGFVAIGFVTFFFVALTVGVRLVHLWWRTRQLPELLIGLGVLGIGPVGFGGMVGGMLLQKAGHEGASAAVYCISYCAIFGGVLAKYVFNWRVYHPASRFALAVVYGAGVSLLLILLYRILTAGFIPTDPRHPLLVLQSSIQVGALMWGSAEAMRYHVMMERRSAIGLADPVVSNRFLLWGFGAGCAGLGTAFGMIISIWTNRVTTDSALVLSVSSAMGFLAAVAMFLAFVPPKRYLAFVQSRGPAEG